MGGFRRSDPETSRLAYDALVESGVLSVRRMEICGTLAGASHPRTAGEIADQLSRNRNNVATRMSELEQMGVIEKVLESRCAVTDMTCWRWQLTGNEPRPLPRRQTRERNIDMAMALLLRENADLKRKLANAGCLFCRGQHG